MHTSPIPDDLSVEVRPYEHGDATGTLAVFLAAVTETASADYTSEQIQAWADPDGRDLHRWDKAMAARKSFVAIVSGQIAGFSQSPEKRGVTLTNFRMRKPLV
ncbi:hypothetical protein N1027_05825 [Herbiconiux sp. CPCC 205763]|uniref:GNAT family N-acetyltransferase n=1 Tax=Herbiconiux aconitum TaxID=2970913 RepID=A0ABT2GNA8_9MICO|nr:hypothetical protein [Herbiconiux aconitum]MCS5717653.1 hypothetical protein [Herbiconiux aconitum]